VNDLGGSGAGLGASHSAADLVVEQIRRNRHCPGCGGCVRQG
jgi:hypothetical protein